MAKRYDNKIDVIIPLFNTELNILKRCILSILTQDIVKDIEITVVDDASDNGIDYQREINKLSELNLCKINYLTYKDNGGPGIARQCGLDNTTHGLVTFIDSDDTFNGSYALKVMRTTLLDLNSGKNVMVSTIFDQVNEFNLPKEMEPGPVFLPHQNDMIWVFGKMYKRSFIDENNIKFHPTSRANEDNGFNKCFQLLSDENHMIVFNAFHTYYWHDTEGSITRHSDNIYAFGSTVRDSFYGYCENMAYAIKFALAKNPFNGGAQRFACEVMLIIYHYYLECVARANEHAAKNFEYAKRYYNEIFKDIEPTIPDKLLAEIYSEIMKGAYMSGSMSGFIPSMTIKEFLTELKK